LGWINVSAIAVGLAMDAFAVSIGTGVVLDRVTPRHVFRMAFHFGLFQFLMPILGWWGGSAISSYVATYDHWLACGLLTCLGGKMVYDALFGNDDAPKSDPTKGWTLVALSVATSIDALAVGLSMAFLKVSVWVPCMIIGAVAAAFSSVGICFGARLPRRWRGSAGILGGAILVLIGLRILVSHLSGEGA